MSTFANAFTDTYAVDGLILKVMTSAWDIRQQVMSHMRDFLREGFDGDDKAFDKMFQAKIFNMSTDKTKAIVRFQIYGSLCRRALQLPAGYLAYLNEVHIKSYAHTPEDPSLDKLRDAIYASEGGQQASLFGASQYTNVQKGDGRGWRIGDRKSDYSFVCYTRRGQRPGIEVRVKDAPVRRNCVQAIEAAVALGANDYSTWCLVISRVAKAGALRLEQDLTKKGIAPNDFIKGFTDERSANSPRRYSVRSTLTNLNSLWTGDEQIYIDAQEAE